MSFFARLCGCSSTPRTNETPSTTARPTFSSSNPHNITSGSSNPNQVGMIYQVSSQQLQQPHSSVTSSTANVPSLGSNLELIQSAVSTQLEQDARISQAAQDLKTYVCTQEMLRMSGYI